MSRISAETLAAAVVDVWRMNGSQKERCRPLPRKCCWR